MTYDEVRAFVAAALDSAADAHEAGRYSELAPLFQKVDVPETRGDGPQFAKIGLALNFFDGWVDASNHEWRYYEGFTRDDWPRLARIVATALRTDREIPAQQVLERFGVRQSVRDPSILQRIRRTIFG